jgi:hypothetical protein
MQWLFYLTGAFITLVWKWQKYVYEAKGKQISVKQASKEWIEFQTFNSQISWGMTIAFVWVIGALYINHLDFDDAYGMDWIVKLPDHASVAFLLGVMAEMIIPEIGKRFISKLGLNNGD